MNKTKLIKILKISTFIIIGIGLLFSALMIIYLCNKKPVDTEKKPTETQVTLTPYVTATEAVATDAPTPTPSPTPEPITYKDYTLLSAGDAMLYQSMVDCAKKLGGDTYDFSDLTKYVKDIISKADFAVVNFEATCLGNGAYKYYPTFNVPDSFAYYLKEAGFDGALFANNHSYDTLHDGFIRTQEILKDNGLTVYGARTDESYNSYGIYNMGDVKLGILNYTYEAPCKTDGTKYLNWIKVNDTDVNLIDTFNEELLGDFYSEIEKRIGELKSNGAEIVVLYLHWGDEYEEQPNELQKAIGQKMCDIGVDLLVGSHTHCVEPIETFSNEENGHKMLCYYSLGNFTSAQNRLTFETNKDRGIYTENEILSLVTIRKYSTGQVVIARADYEPLWQHRHNQDGRLQYNIVPVRLALENEETKEKYGLYESSFGITHADFAYNYMTRLLDSGVKDFNDKVVLPYEN